MENATQPTSTASLVNSTNQANPLQRGVDTAGAALHSGIDKMADPARNTIDRLSASAHGTVDSLASTATHAADRLAGETRRISEAPGQALEMSRSWVQDQPLAAVAGALALGFLMGRLTAR